MVDIKKLCADLDAAIVVLWDEYAQLHEQFNTYRGRGLTPEEAPQANAVFVAIQEKFQELYPAFHFIAHRIEFTNNAADGYNKFIDELQKGGVIAQNEIGSQIVH